jgi:hypothetical protein
MESMNDGVGASGRRGLRAVAVLAWAGGVLSSRLWDLRARLDFDITLLAGLLLAVGLRARR